MCLYPEATTPKEAAAHSALIQPIFPGTCDIKKATPPSKVGRSENKNKTKHKYCCHLCAVILDIQPNLLQQGE